MSATLTIPEVAELLGVSRNTAYSDARRDGEIAGVPVIRVGRRRLLVAKAPLLELLGVDETTDGDPG